MREANDTGLPLLCRDPLGNWNVAGVALGAGWPGQFQPITAQSFLNQFGVVP